MRYGLTDQKNFEASCIIGAIIGIIILIILAITMVPSCAEASVEIDLEIIKQIESGGDHMAINANSGAIGLFQITKICMDDFNEFAPKDIIEECGLRNYLHLGSYCEKKEINAGDLFNPLINMTIANWYMNTRIPQLLKHFNHEDTVENRLISYNCGVGCVGKKLPRETINYIKKYRRLQ